ncbi:plastocyanin/azurin family copper-binding protein [Candidatus Nitrosotenuis chungbukensis]|uniref:plastocyanin/azurin family copper-binding protein n=2 Tax=Candidatus Nitrosotenuis chungbukensis TaxID=1353246 RepID=UPI0005B28FE5|nr:plastocyanin/azurin family copper-binding protein [Candidatus Nitrosotenuis chungbukensis]
MEQHNETIYRTTPVRTTKMLVIMLGISIAGGAIFFSFWDYWISMPPGNQMQAAPVESSGGMAATGKQFDVHLNFVESPDFRTLAFNALPGEEGHNPDINASVGDRIEFLVANNGKSFHAFGVTAAEEGFEGIIPGTEISSANNPMKPGESGESAFVPSKEGTYYYICTVPGHREMGMVGKINVGSAEAAPKAAAPTGISHNFDLKFIESPDFKTLVFNALPGEEGSNPDFKVKSGDSVTFKVENAGISFHAFAVVSDVDDPTTIVFNSAIKSANNPMKAGETGEVTFIAGAPGEYHYVCTVPGHALLGMQGNFIVEP